MGPLVIGIDCSTTGVKCIVWDEHGVQAGIGRAPLDLDTPAPGRGEQDPRWWWESMVIAVREAVAGIDSTRLSAIAIAQQRETFVCLDERDAPIRPAMLWLDLRAGAEVAELGSERVHRLTGKPPNPTPSYYKLAWMQRHEPDLLAQAAHIVDVHGYLVRRMTGLWVTSIAAADPMGLIDLATGDWDVTLLADVGLRRDQLCELVDPGTVIGPVTADAARELGLPEGLPVVAGAGDGQAAALGADIVQPGRGWLNLGTGLVGGCYSDDFVPRTAYRAMTGAVPGTFSYEIFIGAGTYMVNWFIATFVSQQEREVPGIEDRLTAEATTLPIGSDGLLVVPYWNAALTPYWDDEARGIMLGLTGAHGRAHIFRAVLEGLAFELRLCLEGVDAALAVPLAELVVMGGGARSELWCQMLADVLGIPLVISATPETTCLGAGMLAAVGAGIHADTRAAARAMSSVGRRFEPNAAAGQRYDAFYQVYRDVYPTTRSLFAPLAAARG